MKLYRGVRVDRSDHMVLIFRYNHVEIKSHIYDEITISLVVFISVEVLFHGRDCAIPTPRP